jgi:prevent-host-death family protein
MEMLKTTNVSTLRNELSTFLSELQNGPVLVLSHSTPRAILLDPEVYDSLVERIELLEDLVDGRRAISDFRADPTTAEDAEEVFERLGF